ncbi:tetratricopeptide repeat protein [Xanthomonas hortorum]|uniref:tetratricopeptide repeat protein n=1 Tax=Xanthomonas hortorum TaxID=56454 RepID=UPI002043A065|nr:UDP-N-acetylglucosamine-peptide N-acetylglucosaminyltransferase [Xanthomonas hortorum]MCM5621873.1 UDP-N-acetylglucosamine-peptide N-acetylglucosaminyltransferase [Xanthomonas hortorum pv. pelargonii]MCM5635180.1 UDP-N-acetylglucosamine-peptide N-acetylglucosaminyltransferase [Xanthomonas hortorum pv. pelargonii]MCM5637852.1 UDP-N-acetylglucosamine-peptide N-acetylglucosaminyltransferase [Xanthomonas hortorum pv. pelargonii]MDC8634373.1 UDP-N-acetylglucosamine-peptide N-acetylglucosaminyltra
MKTVEDCKLLVRGGFLSPEKWEVNLALAERLLSEALLDDPNNPLLLTCLGAVLCDQGQHKAAAMQLRYAIAHGSQDRNTFLNLGVALLKEGLNNEA